MTIEVQVKTAKQTSRRTAVASGLVAFFITSGLVSWATPDGNLIVTLVPSLVVGGLVFGIASWCLGTGTIRGPR